MFNLFSPGRATTLALSVLEELARGLDENPGPVVFAVFSGGHKACLYKILQILRGNCDGVDIDAGRFEAVKKSLAGLMFDSSPVDFVSDLGAKFVSHQVLAFQPGKPLALISWAAYAVGKALDVIFAGHLQPQRIDLWHTLYYSVMIGPILFLCSENDKLAPIETVHIFASNLRKFGGKVDLVSWKESEHVGHFRLYPEQYSIAVRKLLSEAASVYIRRLNESAMCSFASSTETAGSTKDSPFLVSSVKPGVVWTDLPDSVATEIKRLSRLPHVQARWYAKDATKIDLQAWSMSQDFLDMDLFENNSVSIRSRL